MPLDTTLEKDFCALLQSAVQDDPNDISAGIPDHAIDAGIEAWEAANNDLANYVSGETKDWDEGMIVAAIFKAVGRALLEAPSSQSATLDAS